MSKLIYCANCGLRLQRFRKALPKYGRIVDLIEPHVCTEEPHEFDITPMDVPTYTPSGENNKFVKKLNELSPPTTFQLNNTLKDRRPTEQVKSSAPESILSHVKNSINTTPTNNTFSDHEFED